MSSFDVNIQANPNLSSTKDVDLKFATIGDTLNYSVVIRNSGDTEAFNIIITDLIPQGANFIDDTVIVNGTPKSGVNPANGIAVDTIPIGNSATITFKATVVTLPYTFNLPNYAQVDYQYVDPLTTPSLVTALVDSSTVITTINTPLMQPSKTCDITTLSGAVGQTLTYSITLINRGNTTASNIVFIDTTPVGTAFVPDSVSVFGTQQPGADLNPPGFNFGLLPPNFFTTLSFKVVVTSIPANYQISNFVDVTFNYVVDPVTPRSTSGRSSSNTVVSTQNLTRADLSGITKRVNKAYATTGDILIYTITIPNSGTTTAINVVVIDTVPNGTAFIPNTVAVNGGTTSYLPSSIPVGTIAVGQTATISFNVIVL